MDTNLGRRHVLQLAGLRARVRLGQEPHERVEPQEVLLSVAVEFEGPPRACDTDRLEDTVCGDELCRALVRVCHSRPYALIEHLAAGLFDAACALVRVNARVELELVKVAPPIAGLEGGMRFVIAGGVGPSKAMRALATCRP
jgi:7,8-dihydroneopterin aldolase/epimerase/oxygenase